MEESVDGFRLVKSKRKTNQPKHVQVDLKPNKCVDESHIDLSYIDDLYKKIEKCKSNLRNHDRYLYVPKMLSTLRRILANFFESFQVGQEKSLNIVCYGIGSVDDCFTSRYQLALLLVLIEELTLAKTHCTYLVDLVEFYDPIFSKADRLLLTEKLKFKISEKNEKCMKRVNSSVTLFFMPHCPKALYNNLIYANWSEENLRKFILLGNSFSTIESMHTDNSDKYWYLFESFKVLEEIRLDYTCQITNAFYDLNFHLFNKDFSSLNLSMNQVPVYGKDEEIS